MEAVDLSKVGKDLSLDLLRAIAMGGKSSWELNFLFKGRDVMDEAYQSLALAVSDVSLPEPLAKLTFENLHTHQEHLSALLGRPVGLKAASLDLVENIEAALNLESDSVRLSYYQLEQMAYRDHLTGLKNFRFFNARLNEELQRARRYRHQLTLIIIDIDHFKKFNDTHGHQHGNLALQHLAQVLESTARDTDIVARYGGEEFAIILPETTKRLAAELASRIRSNVEGAPVAVDGAHHRVTVSLGLATFPRDAFKQDQLIECADKALYQSKQAGRNRLSLYEPPSSALFRYRPPAGEAVTRCSVVGSFNGWDPQADPLHPTEDGAFWAKVGLIPGTYEYKFVINGERWIADPDNSEHISDGYWGYNTVLHVKA